jgi:hypothetical protein
MVELSPSAKDCAETRTGETMRKKGRRRNFWTRVTEKKVFENLTLIGILSANRD